jgi:putative transposase
MKPASTSPRRKQIRLKGYDYASEGAYFVTIVTEDRLPLFGEIVEGEMRLNELGKIVRDEWLKTAVLRENVELCEDEFVVMPNHFHGIIHLFGCRGTARRAPTVEQFGKPVLGSIPTIIRAFKSATTRGINLYRNSPGEAVWQRNYYEHIIGTDREFEQIAKYISDNPRNWMTDKEQILEYN